MTLIAHMADIHLGNRQYGLVEREGDVYEAFEESVEKIIQEHASIVVLAGDIFDAVRPPVKALMHAKRLFKKLSERGVRIFYVLGDHDRPKRLDELPPTRLFDELEHVGYRNVELEVGSQRIIVTGLDRIPASLMEEGLQDLKARVSDSSMRPGKRILVAHLPLDWGAEKILDYLPAGYSYIALGHEHRRLVFKRRGTLAAYAGSLEILSRSEVEDWVKEGKGFYMVDISGEEAEIQRVDVDSVRPQRVATASLDELSATLEELRRWASRLSKKPIIHLSIFGKGVDAGRVARLLDQELRDVALYYRFDVREEVEERVVDAPSVDIPSLLREYLISKGLSKEDADFAVEIYEAFRTGGEAGVEEVVMKRASKVREE
ncbi:MAG: DNA repair exonuclease [Nitrososphaerota archaeon]